MTRHKHYWNHTWKPYHMHRGRHRGGWMLLPLFLFLFLLFSGLLWKVLFFGGVIFFALWALGKAKTGGLCFGEDEKRKNDLEMHDEEKPKRQYIQTSDGQQIEII
ncbi:MAG: hypothetical protein HXY40_17230 [Chloroflexi bacterium]|nr:hypothetical protein [Chloroflexota bacterium]